MGVQSYAGTFYGSYIDVSEIEDLRERFNRETDEEDNLYEFDDFYYELMLILSGAGLTKKDEEIECIHPDGKKKIVGYKWVSLVKANEFEDDEARYFIGVKLTGETAEQWAVTIKEATTELDEIFGKIAPLGCVGEYKEETLVWNG